MSILDMKSGKPSLGEEISNFFLPLKYLITTDRFDALVENINFNYLANGFFWIFLLFCAGFVGFHNLFQVKEKPWT